MEFTLYSFTSLLAWLTALLCGILVLKHNPRNPVNIAYFWLSLTITIWVSGCFLESTVLSPVTNYYIDLYLYTGAAFAPAAFLHSILAVLDKVKEKKFVVYLSYFLSVIFLTMNYFFRDIYILEVNHRLTFRFIAQPGPMWFVYISFFAWATVYGLFHLYLAAIKEKGIQRNQLQYLSFSYTVVIIAASFYLLLVFSIETPPIDNLLVMIYSGLMVYTFTRARLMDTEIIIRKGLLYTATTTVVTGLYIIAIYTSNFLFNRIPGFNVLWFMLPAIFILALLFQPIKNRLQEFLDRNFFKTKYESDKIAHKFSDGVKKIMKIPLLAEYISRSAMQTFKLFGTACFIYNEEKNLYVCEDARGSFAALKRSELFGDLEIIKQMKHTGHLIVAEELQFAVDKTRRVKKGDNRDRSSMQKMLEEMGSLKAVIAIPSISKKKDYKLIAFLVADRKKSEDAFSGSDIALLENLASQVVVSIENAMLYEEQFKTIAKSMNIEKLADLGKATAGVASEAQNALSYIEWFSGQLPQKKNDREFLLSQSKTLFAEVEKMRLLMQGVLEFSRPSPLRIEKLDARKYIDDVVVLVQETAAKRGINVSVSCDEGLEIDADKSGIKQVLLNLLMNAIEAMPSGGQLSVKAQTQDGAPVIYVSDTGHGITPQVMQRIFEPFFTTKEHGIGLGLSIVDQSLKAMNGTISFDSEPGRGTTVKVELKNSPPSPLS
ncbi:MAG: ATP-binding protein [Candidatus Margulisiibacteriota bacterium]